MSQIGREAIADPVSNEPCRIVRIPIDQATYSPGFVRCRVALLSGPLFETYTLVPRWKSAKIVLPAVLLAFLGTVVRLAVWPIQAFRTRRRASLRDISETPRILARLGSFFQIVEIVMAAWFLTAGNLAVRLGEPYIVPLALLMYAFGWFGVVGAGTGVWDMVRRWNQLGVWARGGSVIATSAAIVLALFCVVWRIAGTNLEF